MGKLVVIGDIHGRAVWRKIVDDNPDAVRESNFANDDLGLGDIASEIAAWKKSRSTKKGGK